MNAQEIIDYIANSEKKTPVKVYVNTTGPVDFGSAKVFGSADAQGGGSYVVFGDWGELGPILEASADKIILAGGVEAFVRFFQSEGRLGRQPRGLRAVCGVAGAGGPLGVEKLVFPALGLDEGQHQHGFLPAFGGLEALDRLGVFVPQGHQRRLVHSVQLAGKLEQQLFHETPRQKKEARRTVRAGAGAPNCSLCLASSGDGRQRAASGGNGRKRTGRGLCKSVP